MSDGTAAVLRHLAAVDSGDVDAMAADYAPDAVLVRPDRTFRGPKAIAEYFRSVPARLGGGVVVFEDTRVVGGPHGGGPEDAGAADTAIVVRWRIAGGPGDGRAGRDTYRVVDDRIVHQLVSLDDGDF